MRKQEYPVFCRNAPNLVSVSSSPHALSIRPSKFAGCNLLDFVYSFAGRMKPNTDIAITLPKLGGQVFDRYTFVSRRPQGADYSPLQPTARRRHAPLHCYR